MMKEQNINNLQSILDKLEPYEELRVLKADEGFVVLKCGITRNINSVYYLEGEGNEI